MILGMLGLGFYMQDLPLSPEKLRLYAWHKWAGITVFLLAVIRLIWRLTHRPPALPDALSHREKQLSKLAHWFFYGLMLLMPMSGWLMSSAKGFPTVWFGVIPIPDLVPKDKALGEVLANIHQTLAWILSLTVTIHVLAVIKHQFMDGIPVFNRMSYRSRNES